MKLITEFDKEDIRGSFVTDAMEYSISGKVINRKPLEVVNRMYYASVHKFVSHKILSILHYIIFYKLAWDRNAEGVAI